MDSPAQDESCGKILFVQNVAARSNVSRKKTALERQASCKSTAERKLHRFFVA
jgi:hypothetical protein